MHPRRLGALLLHLLTATCAFVGPAVVIPGALEIDSAQRLVVQTMGAALVLALGLGIPLRRPQRVLPLALLATWLLVTAALGRWPAHSLMALGPVLVGMLWAAAITLAPLPRRWASRWWHLAVAGCLVSAGIACIGQTGALIFLPEPLARLGYASPFANPLGLGGATALAGVIAVGALLASGSHRSRALWGSAGVALLLTLLASGSRGALLGFAVGAFGLTLLGRRPSRRVVLGAAIVIALVVGFLLALGPRSPAQVMLRRVGETFDQSSESTQHRLRLWQVAGGLIAESPAIGHGWKTYGLSFQEELWERLNGPDPAPWRAEAALLEDRVPRHAHCDHLEVAVSGGIPALILLWLVGALALRSAWRSSRDFASTAAFGVILAMLVLALVDFPFQRPYHAWLFFVAVGVAQRSEA